MPLNKGTDCRGGVPSDATAWPPGFKTRRAAKGPGPRDGVLAGHSTAATGPPLRPVLEKHLTSNRIKGFKPRAHGWASCRSHRDPQARHPCGTAVPRLTGDARRGKSASPNCLL